MMLYNKTKASILVKDITVCNSTWSKATGLMFAARPRSLIFVMGSPQIVPLHMVFVHFPIDVLFLDKDWKVVEKKTNFKPYRFYTPKNKATYIIELPCETTMGCDLGDTLEHREPKIYKY